MKVSNIYRRIIIEESLKDNLILNEFMILGLSITKEKNPANRWHMYSVEAFDMTISKLTKIIKNQNWYAHFWNGVKMIVVFSNKTFKFRMDDLEGRDKAVQYGILIGIPKKQLDFSVI